MVWVIPIILLSSFNIVITFLPSGPVEWVLSKFEWHLTLDKESINFTALK
ncbi:YfmQ family protein [Mesobacillus subterraneus]|uniref:Uncharacterized protein n=1 Tax=Mesobacillus subterraneus TaxID=285983 RepID=A0A3R9E841_9BACI|nr:hypothetical protein EJA10_14690 [Mesobacillus subterraneus]